MYASLDEWIAHEATSTSPDTSAEFDASVATLLSWFGTSLQLLGLGEALHGGVDVLGFRNRLFQRLVEAHGFRAIALESSFPRARHVNQAIGRHATTTYDQVAEIGFSHDFGKLDANRRLVEWMRRYNRDPADGLELHFYGFDSPTEFGAADSPGHVLRYVLDYLGSVDGAAAEAYRERLEALLGADAAWEDPGVVMDPGRSVGGSDPARALRVETEELISELTVRRPELAAATGHDDYAEALQYASSARQLLNYHAALARTTEDRVARGLGLRDAMMADNLAYIVERERARGRVLAFAHNSHLQRGRARWQLGPLLNVWWPAGAHVAEMLGPGYAAIGTSVRRSEAHGIREPEPGTLESRLTRAGAGSVRLVPTQRARELPAPELARLPTRSGSEKNPTYFPLTAQSLSDFDCLAVFDSTA